MRRRLLTTRRSDNFESNGNNDDACAVDFMRVNRGRLNESSTGETISWKRHNNSEKQRRRRGTSRFAGYRERSEMRLVTECVFRNLSLSRLSHPAFGATLLPVPEQRTSLIDRRSRARKKEKKEKKESETCSAIVSHASSRPLEL